MLISLVFQAVNKASSSIIKIGQDVAKLGMVSSVLSAPGMKQGFGVFADGFGLASLAATKAMQTIESQVNKAQSLQQQFVGNASSLSAQTARSFDESYGVIAEISNKITEISAPLPGETQKYKDIGNTLQASIIRGYVDKKGNVDFAGFGQAVTELSTNYGALSMGKGMGSQNATLFLQRALNGSSFAELNQLEFGEKSPEVINAIKSELKKLGYTELKSISGLAKRAELLGRATRPFVSEEFIEKSSNTIEGITESFNTKVFDQRVGIFGMFREVNDKGTGIKNAIEAYTKFLSAVIGDKGIFAKLGEFARTIGIAIDPMQIAHDMFLLFTEGVLILGNGIEAATNSFKKNKNIFSALGAFLDTVATQIAEDLGISNFKLRLPEQLDGLFSFLGEGISQAKIIAGKGIDFLLPKLESGFVIASEFFVDLFNDFSSGKIKLPDFSNLSSPDFSGLANIDKEIAPFINKIIRWTGDQFSGVTLPDVKNAGRSAGVATGELASKTGDGASGFIKSTFDVINGINWGEISTMIGDGILAGVVYFREATKSSVPGIVDGLVKVTDQTVEGLNTGLSNVKDSIFADGNFGDLNTKVAIGSYQFGESIGIWLGSAVSYLANLDWGGILIGIGDSAIILGGLFIVSINALCSSLGGLFNGINDEVIRGTAKPFKNFSDTTAYAIIGICQSTGEMFTSAWDSIKSGTKSVTTPMFSNIGYGIKGSMDSFGQAWNDISSYTVKVIKDITKGVTDYISKVFQDMMNTVNSIKIPGLNLNVGQTAQVAGSAIGDGLSAANTNIIQPVWNSPIIKKITGRYMGNIPSGYVPNAANGLMSAINEERLNMPLGANIVVANDKEFILSPTNKKLSNTRTQSSSSAPTIGNITININGVGRNSINIAEEVADLVIGMLEGRIETEFSANIS